jgi:hypothetical protein
MSDYNDIAKRNPQGAVGVISSFGYEIVDRSNLGQSLNELIAQEGEPALRKVMEIHPDKDVILELFSNQTATTEKQGCGCSSCNQKHGEKYEHYMNASGSGVEASTNTPSNSNILAHQTNNILIVASLFIATVLILKIK